MNSREIRMLRRGGPEALAAEAERQAEAKRRAKARQRARPVRALGKTYEERQAEAEARWLKFKAKVARRHRDRCEYRDRAARCTEPVATTDHFWSGHGRRRALESVESCWGLCAFHDQLRTHNDPTRLFWVAVFEGHVIANGLWTQLPLIARERARLKGKRRSA